MAAGIFALMTLVKAHWSRNRKLQTVSYVFASTLGCSILCCILWPKRTWFSSFMWLTSFFSLAALYGDWALGSMVGNILGTPNSDNIYFYVAYLVLKRFTMLSL
jgi:hypothetical protein